MSAVLYRLVDSSCIDTSTTTVVSSCSFVHSFQLSKYLQVRKYLHVILCFSPVGDKFRIRARQFPALVNCTVIDWSVP